VNNVTYYLADIVEFLQRLETAGPRRVLITVGVPSPPARRTAQYRAVHGEDEVLPAGLEELVGVLWDLGRLPDLRVISDPRPAPVHAGRDAAVQAEARAFPAEQWAQWPVPGLVEKAQAGIEAHFDELFEAVDGGFRLRSNPRTYEAVITWRPGVDVR
jgi:hypothetical protein